MLLLSDIILHTWFNSRKAKKENKAVKLIIWKLTKIYEIKIINEKTEYRYLHNDQPLCILLFGFLAR